MPALTIESPVGPLRLVAEGDALVALRFLDADDLADSPLGGAVDGLEDGADAPVLAEAAAQLAAYFAGDRHDFDLPLAPLGTEFQHRVWAALRRIGFGATATYGEIARAIGLTPAASRAVGLANGRNPLPIVVPCHRVIGANGTLTGYAGGLERKRILLDLEQGALPL